MKKVLLLLSIFSALSFSLWLARQLADSGATAEIASQAFLRGDYADALRSYESLAAVPGKSQHENRQGLLRCLLITASVRLIVRIITEGMMTDPSRQITCGNPPLYDDTNPRVVS